MDILTMWRKKVKSNGTILLSKNPALEVVYSRYLQEVGFDVVPVRHHSRIREVLRGNVVHLMIADVDLREPEHGLRIIRGIRGSGLVVPVIAMSAHFETDFAFAQEVQKAGATVLLTTPVEMRGVLGTVQRTIQL